uniref:Non-specific serine/threonine protein kinase n=1 Tax=Panagrolaimus sp. JU765 TaxID=591449 RepID=A0AC34RFS6_9BILA
MDEFNVKNLPEVKKNELEINLEHSSPTPQLTSPSGISSIGLRRNVPTPLSFEHSVPFESPYSSAGITGCSFLVSFFYILKINILS